MVRRKSAKSSSNSTGSTTSIQESRREKQKKKKQQRSESVSARSERRSWSSCTQPDYSVEEDRLGRLINREKRLVWPSAKQLSRKEWNAFIATAKPEMPPSDGRCQSLDENSEVREASYTSRAESSECLTFHEKYAYGKEEEVFIGTATESEAQAKVGDHHAGFVLYYRLEKKPVPDQVELWMAYRRSNGIFMHFPVKRRSYRREGKIHDEYYWRVEAGEANKREFTSLPALVKFYRLFSYIDPISGAIETFPFFD